VRAFVEASETLGLPHVSDFNGATQHGAGPYTLNVFDGVRVNTGMTYLTASVRTRPNLVMRSEAEVDRVVFHGRRAVGVELGGEVLSAGEIILSAGTFGSPAILMRSGIGPSKHLSELEIKILADLPVGDRLQDQPFFYNVFALKPEANAMRPAAGAIVSTRSQDAEPDDLGRS
jgi:choline dehydrogenase